ncbi:MAG: AraC family transcriptional regulator [Kiritimatiellae bacterium]|nr:AraC family transcriptional regulator [Kiritimatiellia bacterium]MDD5522059.1 AraC family transcriptional regulator [Kiritimatiellia bacterium]
MIEDYNLTLLSGGYYSCDPSWNKKATGIDQCYKVYFPVSGMAVLEMDTGKFDIEPGKIYFISGFRLLRQICDSRMDVYWLHFIPESLYLRYLLDQLPPICTWARKKSGWSMRSYEEICQIFEYPNNEENRPRIDSSPVAECRIQGLLLSLVSRLLEKLDKTAVQSFHPEYYHIKPALNFINSNYTANPSLNEIAGKVGMAPNYFHRKFKELFGVTPFNYMLAQRLNKARHLLASSTLSIKEVAETVGYDNPLYFTRVFSSQMHMTPSEYRAANMWSTKNRGRNKSKVPEKNR